MELPVMFNVVFIVCLSYVIADPSNIPESWSPNEWIDKSTFYNLDENEWASYGSAPDFSGDGGLYDDDDDSYGSGDPIIDEPELTHCQQAVRKLMNERILGAYMPQCTDNGDYEALQCHASIGMCWCVDFDGQEIPGSKKFQQAGIPSCDAFRAGAQPEFPPINPEYVPAINNKPPRPSPSSTSTTTEVLPDERTSSVEVSTTGGNTKAGQGGGPEKKDHNSKGFFGQTFVLAGIIGGAVVGLLCAVLIIMFLVYRMRKKDEGSYVLDEKRSLPYRYQPANSKEYFA